MGRKQARDAASAEMQRYVNAAQDQMSEDIQMLYVRYGSLVHTWMNNEMTTGELNFEQAAVHLARNFMLAHQIAELSRIGKDLEREFDEHTVGDVA